MAPPDRLRLSRERSPDLGTVEVVRDRGGVRMLVSGVLYSVRRVRPESIPPPWLLLAAAPLLALPAGAPARPRVAILGYGGGTVARLLRAALPGVRLTGVEPDPAVRRAARSELGSDVRGVRMIAARAETFLAETDDRFDAILDDVFAPRGGRLARPEAGADLPFLARRRLAPGGIYAVNLISPARLTERRTGRGIAAAFPHGTSVAMREYAHRVVIGSDAPLPRGAIAAALARLLAPAGAAPAALRPAALGVARVRRFSAS